VNQSQTEFSQRLEQAVLLSLGAAAWLDVVQQDHLPEANLQSWML